jgi:hypothetical protein
MVALAVLAVALLDLIPSLAEPQLEYVILLNLVLVHLHCVLLMLSHLLSVGLVLVCVIWLNLVMV